jgi:hypothetical protein
MLINAVVLAMTLPADPAELAAGVPTCTAVFADGVLSTQVAFADGYTVEAPWRVLRARNVRAMDGSRARVVSAVLDRIVETNALTGQRSHTRFRERVDVTFRGRTQDDVNDRAAALWCTTVLRMNGGPQRFAPSSVPRPRVARLPGGTTPTA